MLLNVRQILGQQLQQQLHLVLRSQGSLVKHAGSPHQPVKSVPLSQQMLTSSLRSFIPSLQQMWTVYASESGCCLPQGQNLDILVQMHKDWLTLRMVLIM